MPAKLPPDREEYVIRGRRAVVSPDHLGRGWVARVFTGDGRYWMTFRKTVQQPGLPAWVFPTREEAEQVLLEWALTGEHS